MTDAEIIKALECCIKGKCSECPLKAMFCSECVVMGYALDLINRQKEEIEMLKSGVNVELDNFASEYDSKIKAEAIKEFAERLKENTIDVDVSYGYGREHYTEAVAVIEIDNLAKEMAGD